MLPRLALLSFLSLTSILHVSFAQDSSPPPGEDTLTIEELNREARRTMIKSMVLPGWGQVSNGHVWKVPILYAGLGVVTYSAVFASQRYVEYRDAYNWRVDGDSTTIDKFDPEYFPDRRNTISSAETLRDTRDFYRRNFELSIISGVLLYSLNILDAYVYAHLKDFDVSDDLSLRIIPPKIGNIANRHHFSLGVQINMK